MAVSMRTCGVSSAPSSRVKYGQFVARPGNGAQRLAGRRQLPIVAVKDVTSEAEFEKEVLQSDVPVLVDFWAPWCGPCKLVAPLMKWAEEEYAGSLKAVKVEHGPNPELIEKYKVYGLPTLIVFKGGQEVPGSKTEGAIGRAQLAEYLKKHVEAPVKAA